LYKSKKKIGGKTMESKKKNEKHELAKEGMKAISEIEDTIRLENVIKDNKIVFTSGKNTFRVRKPSLSEQQEIDTIRRKKYGELVSDDSYMFKKQWVEIYNKKGVDINKMYDDAKRIQDDIRGLLLRLAKTSDPKSIKTLKDEINKTRDKLYNLSIRTTDLLVYSIEDQLTIHVNSYTAYVVLERKEEEKWVKHFESYDVFEKSQDNDLIRKTFKFLNDLMYGTK